MADRYALQQVGVVDGTQIPALKADGRSVGANKRSILASKVTGVTWAVNDRIYLGEIKAGDTLVDIKCTTGTSFSTSTLDIGDGTTVDRFVDGKTLTATDTPTSLGPKASILDDGPFAVDTPIWLTVLTTDIASGTVATFELEFIGV